MKLFTLVQLEYKNFLNVCTLPFKDEAQAVLFKDAVRTAL